MGRDLVEYDEEQETRKREERWEAYEAFIAASQNLTAIIKQLNEAHLELRNDFKKINDLFNAYIERHNDLDVATIAANKRSRELDDIYAQLEAPMPKLKTRRVAH